MIFIPPQFGKTEQVTIHHQAYYLEMHPGHNTILASYSQTQANKYSRRIRAIARGRVALSRDRRAVTEWETAQGGGLKAVGVNAGVTGNRADAIYVDDPLKGRREAESPEMRNSIWDWYNDELITRLVPGGPVYMILTRWHDDDIAGRILNTPEGKRYTVLSLPAIATQDEQPVYDDDGKLVYKGRKKGESLNPKRYPAYRLQQFRERNERTFQSLYQQMPGKPEGNVWKRAWFNYWKTMPPVFEELVVSIDPSFDGGDSGSYVVIQVWGLMQGRIYLLDQIRERMDYVETEAAIKRMAAKWPLAYTKLIEKAANGHALLSSLTNSGMPGLVPITVTGKGSKEFRARGVSRFIKAGAILLPDPSLPEYTWVRDVYLDEVTKFPSAANDDQVDATSQLLHWLFAEMITQAEDEVVEAIEDWDSLI